MEESCSWLMAECPQQLEPTAAGGSSSLRLPVWRLGPAPQREFAAPMVATNPGYSAGGHPTHR